MKPFRFTLRGDGTSDAMLIPVIRWVLLEQLPDVSIVPQFATRYAYPRDPADVADELFLAATHFPCDLLVVHRDAEAGRPEDRVAEIRRAAKSAGEARGAPLPYVCVVPVRMTEAWMLFDEPAIRRAAENPNGTCKLHLPGLRRVESVADPKSILFAALETASEYRGRKLKKFKARDNARLVPAFIDDFAPLRALSAFQAFEADIRAFVKTWSPPE